MTPTPKTFRAFRPDPELDKAMLKLHARDGISISEQMRRALEKWLKEKGVYTPKKEKKR